MCSSPFSPIALRQGLSGNRKLVRFWLDWLTREYWGSARLCPQVLGLLSCAARASFYMGAGDSNPRSSSALTAEHSSPPSRFASSSQRLPGDIVSLVTSQHKALTGCDCLLSNVPTFRIPSLQKRYPTSNAGRAPLCMGGAWGRVCPQDVSGSCVCPQLAAGPGQPR